MEGNDKKKGREWGRAERGTRKTQNINSQRGEKKGKVKVERGDMKEIAR